MKRLTQKIKARIIADAWTYVEPYGIPRELYDAGTVELDDDHITCVVIFRHKTATHSYDCLPENKALRIEFTNVYFDEETGGILECRFELT